MHSRLTSYLRQGGAEIMLCLVIGTIGTVLEAYKAYKFGRMLGQYASAIFRQLCPLRKHYA